MRYFHTMELTARTSHTRLSQLCHADYDRECALIATIAGEHGDDIVAVGRLSREQHETTSGELALVVSDAWQGRGLGHSMVTRLLAVAPLEGYRRLTAAVLPDNGAMRHLLGESGFTFVHDLQEGTCIGTWNSPSKPGIHSPIV
jgi:acetyltransferase